MQADARTAALARQGQGDLQLAAGPRGAGQLALQLLADADQVLTQLAARAFEASAVLFIEWALGGSRRLAQLSRAHA